MKRYTRTERKRDKSDEHYVIDLCDEVLGFKAFRQYGFDFLRGCSGRKLPVDAYYRELNVVVEYWESQHTKANPFFDNKMTPCGITRGEQRKIYDKLREVELPKHGIKLVVIQYSQFGKSKRIQRNHDKDVVVVENELKKNNVLK